MALGWFESGVCYSVHQDAIDYHFQTIPPMILTTTTTTSIYEYIRTATGWNHKHSTVNGTGVITQQFSVAVPNPIQGSCTLTNDPSSNFSSGVELGWAVAGVMVIAYGLKRLRRGW